MKHVVVFFAFLLSAPLVAASTKHASRPSFQTQTKMQFEQTLYDFGKVKRGERLTHKFSFMNKGSGNFVIQGIHADCGCTVAKTETNKAFRPAEQGVVEVVWDTTDFKGKHSKAVSVMTDEQPSKPINLTLMADIEEEIYAEPPIIDFGDVTATSEREKQFKVKSNLKSPLDISNIEFDNKAYDLKFSRLSSSEFLVHIKLKDHLIAGFKKDRIQILNNTASLPRLPLLVRANIKGNIDVSPAYLEFGVIDPGGSSTRVLKLQKQNNVTFQNTQTELLVNGERVKDVVPLIKIQPASLDSPTPTLSVTLTNQAEASGSVHGRMTFDTNDPSQKQFSVDFYAFFSKEGVSHE